MLTRRHEETFAATENDVLRDTDLRQAPGPGAVAFWAGSTVSDSTISIRVGGVSLAHQIIVPNRGTNAPIEENNQAPIAIVQVRGGELLNVDVVEVTAMTLRLVAIWSGLS